MKSKNIIKSVIHGNPNVTDDPFDKNMGLKFQECWDDEGNYYPMYYRCHMWRNIIPFNLYNGDRGIRILAGYKNFAVYRGVPNVYTYGYTVVPNFWKLFVKG